MLFRSFDCTLPTRDARHKRLYVFNNSINSWSDLKKGNFYKYLYMGKDKFINSNEKISDFCDCYTCQNYSLGYLNYLFKIKSVSAHRLASIHNMRFYSKMFDAYYQK